jgi:hypothetical protein
MEHSGQYVQAPIGYLKVSTDLSWSVILEFLGTFYGSLRGGLDAMFKHQVPRDPFGDFGCGGDSGDDDDDDGDAKVIAELMAIEYGVQNATLPIVGVEEPQPSIERSLAQIGKLVEEAMSEAKASGLDLINHLHSMMLKVVSDVCRVHVLKENKTIYPQSVFSVVDNGDGHSILRKKDWREQMMGSKKRRRTDGPHK